MTKLLTLAVSVSIAIALGITPAQSRAADDAITITPADFRAGKDKILEQVTRLENMSAGTADYARLFQQIQQDIARAKPPVTEWTDKEQERIRQLTEPTQAAWDALNKEKEQTQRRIEQRNADAEQAHQELVEQQNRNAAQQAAAEKAERDAELKETQIRESLARTRYYEDADRYYPYYGSNWWWTHPVKPRPVPKGENRYYGTKPYINDYKGRPMR